MLKNTPIKAPPAQFFVAPVIFHIRSLYKEIYSIGTRLPKQDKLGLHASVEKSCLKMLRLGIQASLETKHLKQGIIRKLRVETETLKHLTRAESELNIIKESQYLLLQEKLQEISKEASGWEKYATNNSR